ncbi:Acyl-CoA dehydrogenase [Sphingobium indicum BiD32]|uniref:Acyl-CoA dehydrogenase n=1 Tax=Sphingobium indicum BiD32 TaxID=1301087 RepID=N1MHY8_9SPHN|nr:acyl-CoA dehydrogenase family protein [Sphingobium indicum]CCW16566.1 Acyl-CoA dehydrogenase [Sphingobium indicum BiD32]
MDFTLNDRQAGYRDRVRDFMERRVWPAREAYEHELAEGQRWAPVKVMETLKAEARDCGLWNLFMPPTGAQPIDSTYVFEGPSLSNVEYALCAEEMGRIEWASEVFNCSAPDTGNMEVLHRFGTAEQKTRWLGPLMRGEIRSAFLMTEPDVASSDATNIRTRIERDGDEYVINGRKWWSGGVGDPRCRLAIVMGRSSPEAARHRQQAMILIDMTTPGVRIERMLSVFGYDHAPHGFGEVLLENVRVPASSMILGEGKGFEIAQGRLGPGRIHHCMRTIGVAEVALEAMCRRLVARSAFGKTIAEHSVWDQRISRARIDIETSRLLSLKAADMMDRHGAASAALEVALIKVQGPRVALQILDDAIQAHGGAGVSADFDLARAWATVRTLRLADGPDEVHERAIARAELAKYRTL